MKQVALVTGGSRGIGLGICRELAKAGFRLAINGMRDESEITSVLNELNDSGVEVYYVQGDVSDKKARQDMLDKTLARFGQINVLINNAGIAPIERRDILEATEESFEHLMHVNLQGPYFLTQLIFHILLDIHYHM